MEQNLYCEQCGKEDLDIFIEDRLGTIFCSKGCANKWEHERHIRTVESNVQ